MRELILLGLVFAVFAQSAVDSAPQTKQWDLDDEDNALNRATRRVYEVDAQNCVYFLEFSYMSLYGYNTKKLTDVNLGECLEKCAKEKSFYCRSVDFNADSATGGGRTSCFMSSENRTLQPYDFSPNINTNHYERSCEQPIEEGSAY